MSRKLSAAYYTHPQLPPDEPLAVRPRNRIYLKKRQVSMQN